MFMETDNITEARDQVAELKREEFHRYLEKSGVVDNLTRVLVGLYELPEKPLNATDFIKELMGAPVDEDMRNLKKLIDEQARIIREQEEQIVALKREIASMNGNA